ncbi:response regulator [Flavobacterium sp. NST-5]|uniref:Response regulator n=1 Tax=Flavobacterium ichthyis TaxID=2698827 RepID=A0ABW9Z8C1_9FLAO|nr:response regulator [Flavobacterium ichthyis]NBL64929.1 response regulator [Flavobacterium ichthyis]
MSQSQLQVILIDDDREEHFLFREALAEIANDVHFVSYADPSQLFHHLQNDELDKPDIIFLDLNMPQINGIECLERIRQNQQLNNVKVVIYSTSKTKNDIHNCFLKGADLYVSKPNSFSDLGQMFQRVFATNWTWLRQNRSPQNFHTTLK